MALTYARDTKGKVGNPVTRDARVKAAVKIWQGSLVVSDVTGYAKPGVTGTGLSALGMAKKTVDNTDGANGAEIVPIEPGIHRWANSSSDDLIERADIGKPCYIVDDQTVALTDGTGTRSIAGTIEDVDAVGVWVRSGLSARAVAPDAFDPLIADDSGSVIHVVWRDGALVDLTGTEWTEVGTVPQVPASAGLPAGARGFSGSNHYKTALDDDPADLASFVGCVVIAPTSADLATTSMILTNGQSGATGYELVANEGGLLHWISASDLSDSPLIADEPNVICFGQDSSIGRMYMKANMRPLVLSTGVLVPDTTRPLKLGTHWDNFLGLAGTIYEVWISSAIPGGSGAASYGPELWDEHFAEITRKVFARMRKHITSATSIVWQSTCNVHVASSDQLFEIVATAGTAFAIAAPTGTLRAGQKINIRIKNSAGGALGTVTWNAAFKMATWTSPANGFSRTITFEYNGTNWIEAGRTAADVPN